MAVKGVENGSGLQRGGERIRSGMGCEGCKDGFGLEGVGGRGIPGVGRHPAVKYWELSNELT